MIFVCNAYSSCHADGDLISLIYYLTLMKILVDGDSWFSSPYCCSDIFVDTSIVAVTNAAIVVAAIVVAAIVVAAITTAFPSLF